MEGLQAAISAGNTRIEVAASRLEHSASMIQKGVSPVARKHGSPGSSSIRVGSRKKLALQGLHKDIRQLTTMMRESNVVNPIPRRATRYPGASRNSILLSLLLLKPQLDGVITYLALERGLELLPSHLDWLSSQFESLLSYVLRNVDDLTQKNSFGTRGAYCEVRLHSNIPRGRLDQSRNVRQFRSVPKKRLRQAWYFSSSVGRLSIRDGILSQLQTTEAFNNPSRDIELTFIPWQHINSTAVVAKFRQWSSAADVPQIERLLRSYI